MSLFFGIFAKNRDLHEADWQPSVDELSHLGRRTINIRVTPRFVVAAAESVRELNVPRTATNEQSGTELLLGGEIFDYEETLPELERRGRVIEDPRHQAAVVLHGFEEHGTPFLSQLTGAFALAHHDPVENSLTLANDPFGMHPIFVWDSEDFCVFSSETEPIAQFHGYEPVLDQQAVSEYYGVKQPNLGHTFFRRVRNLEPGTILTTGAVTETSRYDDLAIQVDHDMLFDDAVDETFRLLDRAVRARLRYRDRALAALTGGFDSRLLVGLLTEEERRCVEFRTYRKTWLAEDDDLDFMIAKTLAEQYDLNFVVQPAQKHSKSKVVDRSFLERLRTLKGKAYKFEGFYGGEFLSTQYEEPSLQGLVRRTDPAEVRARLHGLLTDDLLCSLPNPLETLRDSHQGLAAEKQDHLFHVHHQTRAVFTNRVGGSQMGWVMPLRQVSHGQDSIFRDTALLRHLLAVPAEYLRDRRLYDRLYERHLPELCAIPSNRRSSVIAGAHRKTRVSEIPPADFGPLLDEYLGSPLTWEKGTYDEARLRQTLSSDPSVIPAFVDFESWYRERFLPFVG